MVLMAGIERTIDGRHLLLVNFPASCADVGSFEAIAALKAAHPQGLVVVPHAFYPTASALGARLMDAHAPLVDAVEVNAMHTRAVDFNRRAVAWARAHGKPLVGNTDLHLLAQMDRPTRWSMRSRRPTPSAPRFARGASPCTPRRSPPSARRTSSR